MNSNIPFGLGWQPDLPDMRDKTFAVAYEKLKSHEAIGKAAKVSKATAKPLTPGGGTPWQSASQDLHTFDGWNISSSASLQFEEAKAGATDERQEQAWRMAMTKAFGANAAKRPLLTAAPPEKPLPSVDLRPFQSPIEDQEQIGSCTAHAVIGLVEYLQIATSGRYVDASRLFLYKATRELLQWTGDTGAYIRETIKALRLFGVCPETYWSYDTGRFDETASAFCYAFAANYKALRYYRLAGLEELKRSLSQGYPVAFGFTCFESLFTQTTAHTGRIPVPLPTEKAVGGHAVLAVGYNESANDKKDSNACPKGHVIIRNSWGAKWGRNGYGFLPYAFFEGVGPRAIPLADDLWTMTQMDLPDLEQASSAPFALGEGGNPVQNGGGGGGIQ